MSSFTGARGGNRTAIPDRTDSSNSDLTGSAGVGPIRLADGLGVASAALGTPMLLAPRRLLREAGIRSDGKATAVVAAVGVREFLATGTILGMRHRRVGAWSRVAGDMIDLALLGAAFRTRRKDTARLAGAIALIATILATDLYAAIALSRAEGVGVPDGSRSSGAGAAHGGAGHDAGVRTAITALASESELREAFREFPWSAFDARALEGSGRAWFRSAPGDRGTELHIICKPRGRLGGAVLKLLGRSSEQRINDELRQFKSLVETGVEVRSEKTPAPYSSRRQIFQRPAQPTNGSGGVLQGALHGGGGGS
jgi:hypothetical protein